MAGRFGDEPVGLDDWLQRELEPEEEPDPTRTCPACTLSVAECDEYGDCPLSSRHREVA